MIRMTLSRIFNRKMSSITFIFALICLFVLVPFGLHQSIESQSVIKDTIEKYGRGSYDILIRPKASRSIIEKRFGMVEDNYIGDSKGGISIEEWRKIKSNPNIEVAAPVASLGYFRGKQFSIELPVMEKPTRFTYQFLTSNGIKNYPINKKSSLTYFENTRPGLIQYIADAKQQHFSASMNVLMPENYYLLVAIDPESEKRLTDIDFSALKKEPKSPTLQTLLENYGNPPIVKVLQRNDLHIPIFMKLTTETMDINLNVYLQKLHLDKNDWLMQGSNAGNFGLVTTEINNKKPLSQKTIMIDLSNFQHPFDGTALRLDQQLKPTVTGRYTADLNTSVYYSASKIKYTNLEGTPMVEVVKEGNPPSYKNVEKRGVSMNESGKVPFIIEQMGTFSVNNSNKNKLVASPLGIYGENEANLLDGKKLIPTTVPGSFIPSPASGVTTLKSAEIIKGDRPIDAIRVKIAGINKYNEGAKIKIDRVATQLLKGGYEVDVVAGSSFKTMTLDVEGIGKVKEPWTTLGVAQKLIKSWNKMTVVTTCLFIAFGILWILIRFNFERSILAEENQLLHTIGWSQNKN